MNKEALINSRIVVTGGSGFLGQYIVDQLISFGVKEDLIVVPRSYDCDLRSRENCFRLTQNADLVIHAAGNVGGIGKNRAMPGTLFYDNAVMGIELMEAARQNRIKKFVTIGTVCAYPKYTPVPFKESDLWNGYPEETNAAYGLAKKMLLVQGQAYRQQYGFNAVYLLPVNLYGPGDNFNEESSHVIPALIKKVAQAKQERLPNITVWGSGNASREFLYVKDAAQAIIQAVLKYDSSEPLNIGSIEEISIRKLVEKITQIMDYQGDVKWDTSMPDGQPRRKLDTSGAKQYLGFEVQTSLDDGLSATINWYLNNQR